MKKLLAMALAVGSLAACNPAPKQAADTESATKTLVLCYSQTGATRTVAQEIKNNTGADIAFIECVTPYDGDFGATIARWQQEQKDGVLPEIKDVKVNVADYDLIFLGYPVWGGSYAPPIAKYIETEKFEGKKVVTFCTFGSGGLNTSTDNLKAALPKAEVIKGYGVRNARMASSPAEIKSFLVNNGYMKGEPVTLPAYSEMQPVTDEEKAIFDQACSGYQFPLGTAVECGKRAGENSTDYIFKAESQGPDGSTSTSTIYVIKPNVGRAEFTEVVR